ncbi:MAG TPA: KH domain-containing protein, partial [Candidatus Bathyarchaeia archaeon]|nr:KH domain-containing protein [Candidatus Bathyarchaeia archaeon]
LGKVIGRQGRTANSIRTILAAAGSRVRKRVVLEIVD